MKLVKMLGLAMVAAIAAMAFVGVGTASAELCETNTDPCTSPYPSHSTVLVSTSEAVLKGFATVKCASHATLLHEGEDANGVLLGTFTELTWSNCKGCTTVTTTNLGSFDDEATGGGNGVLLPLNVTVLLKGCPLGAECTASSTNGTTKLGLDGGTINGTAKGLAETSVTLSGFGCGKTGTWSAPTPYVVLAVNGSKTGSIFQE